MLASRAFGGASRSQALLSYLVEHALDGRAEQLKEYTLGSEALGRGEAFDPRTDPIVRAEASRLRNRLERYYSTEGAGDQILISLPKGSYMPQFEERREAGAAPMDTRRRAWAAAPWPWIAAAALLAAAGFAAVRWPGEREGAAPGADPVLFDVELSRGDATLGADVGNEVALAPDGTRVVFVGRGTDGQLRLLSKSFRPAASGAPDAVELPGTTGARSPFFSPDGLWVGFWANGMLKKTAVDRGAPVELTKAGDFGGGRWDAAGIIAGLGQSIVRIAPDGSTSSVLLDLADEGIYPRWPDILPGGRHIVFTALSIASRPSIVVLSLEDGSRRTIVPDGSFARVIPEGHLAYVNQGALWTVPIDPRTASVTGTAAPVVEGIAHNPTFGVAQFDISRTGTLIFRRSRADGQTVLAWVDRDGGQQPIIDTPGAYTFPRFSPPDGRRIAFASNQGGRTSIVQYEIQSGRLTPTPVAPGAVSPVWTPDGQFLVVGTTQGLQWIDTEEPSAPKTLTTASVIQVPWSFSPDGRLAYAEMNATSGFDLWTVPVTITGRTMKAGTPAPYLATPAHETYPSISPDGAWMAYGSGRYSTWEVYVRPFPSAGGREIQVSQGGGRIARWLPGQQILYRTDDHRLMVVDYNIKSGSFVPGTPREWMPTRLADTLVLANFDVDRAGQRVAGLLPPPGSEADQPSRNHVTVIVNFPGELKRLAAREAR